MWSRAFLSNSNRRFISTFRAADIQITQAANLKTIPTLDEKLVFGTVTTDHMFIADWNQESGWAAPQIQPYGPLVLDPKSSCLHYGTECFEGMKAYRSKSGKVLLFRPDRNAMRMRKSSTSLGLPEFDVSEWLSCVRRFIDIDRRWVPDKPGFSLYIRPTMIGTHEQLGVVRPQKAKLFIVNSLVGPYFAEGFKPVALYCDDSKVRAWPGGSGDKKVGGNYAPGIVQTAEINKLGYQQLLWLCNDYVTEVGTMNFFVLWKNKQGETELITAPLDSTILEGVTRDSILSLTRQWNQFKVSERKFTIHELVEAIQEKRVIEIFGAGTACIVCPVYKIFYKGQDYQIPLELETSGVITKRIQDEIMAIQYGDVEHPWQFVVDY